MLSWRRVWVGIGIVFWFVLVPVSIGQTTVAGVVTLSNRGLLAGSSLTTGATIFSGDLIATEDDGQVQLQVGRTKLTLLPSSSLRVFRAGEKAVVELERGTMTYSTAAGDDLVIYALDARMVPERGNGGTGQVTIVSRCEMRATSQVHTLEVTSGKEAKTIEETKTYTVASDFGVEYDSSWKPVPNNYPDFDPNSAYHRTHSHSACGLVAKETGPPKPALSSHFKLAAAVITPVVLCLVICRNFESPDKPKN